MPAPVPVTNPRLLGFFSQEGQDGRGIARENVVPVPVAKVGFLGFLIVKAFPAPATQRENAS